VVGIYAATKSALVAFNQALAREIGPNGITANLVQPGSIKTDMNPTDGPFYEPLRAMAATGTYGMPDDIANAVAFLASGKARYITGTILTVDGGATA
jgi:NAD(P)-dependent dehydrogenase (short-subunit alcohol dehydrogenase family)